MSSTFSYDGRTLAEFGAVISDIPRYEIALRDFESVSVPGKSGDILLDHKRFKNIQKQYKIAHIPTFSDLTDDEFMAAITAWLLPSGTYKEFRDSFNPGYFLRAVCTSVSSAMVELTGATTCTVTFNCEPFWRSDSGSVPVSLQDSSGTVTWYYHNPEAFSAEPVIKIEGNGDFQLTVTGGGQTSLIQLTDVTDGIIIDKQAENVTTLTGADANGHISTPFLPLLGTGDGMVRVSSTDSFTLTITPNWRRL